MNLARIATLRGHTASVWSVAWSPRGFLASCGADRLVYVWSKGEDGQWARIAKSPNSSFLRAVRNVSWSPDCRSLAVASFDASATILELTGGPDAKLEPVVCLEGHDSEVKSVAYSSAGGLLATCSRDRSVWIWEVGLDFDYECVAVLSSHRGDVKKVLWHPLIEMLVSCSFDTSIRVWVEDADDWFCSEELMAHNATVWDVCFDHSGDFLFSVSADSSLIVWQRESPHPSVVGGRPHFSVVGRIDGISAEPLYSVSWCPKHRVLAIGGGDDSIHLVRKCTNAADSIKSGTNQVQNRNPSCDMGPSADDMPVPVITTLPENWQVFHTEARAHSGDVNCVSWSTHDKDVLATAGDDGLIRIWQLQNDPPI